MMKRCTVAAIVVSFSFAAAGAYAQVGHQHEGDFIIGVTGSNQLAFEFDEDVLSGAESLVLPAIDPPSPGIREGWIADEPGFEHLIDPEPAEDFYPLGSGAMIYLVGVDVDAGLYVRAPAIGTPIAIRPTPTLGSLLLGDAELHSHAVWHIDLLAAGFDPLQAQWQGTFKFMDMGGTAYTDSEPFTLTFTNVPEPASLGLLTFAWLVGPARRRLGTWWH